MALGRPCLARSRAHVRISAGASRCRGTSSSSSSTNSKKAAPDDVSKASTHNNPGSKMSWMRGGYLGVRSSTDPPDVKFLSVAAVVTAAGFYAWFIDPPAPATPSSDDEKPQEHQTARTS